MDERAVRRRVHTTQKKNRGVLGSGAGRAMSTGPRRVTEQGSRRSWVVLQQWERFGDVQAGGVSGRSSAAVKEEDERGSPASWCVCAWRLQDNLNQTGKCSP